MSRRLPARCERSRGRPRGARLRRRLDRVPDRRTRGLRDRGQAGPAGAPFRARARAAARADARPGGGGGATRPRDSRPRLRQRPSGAGLATLRAGPELLHRVDWAARSRPRVIRGARAEFRLVLDDARVAADLLRPLGMAEKIRVVAMLPDEDEMNFGHEMCDEGAALRRAGERIGRDTEPAGMVATRVVGPQILLRLEADLLLHDCPAFELGAAHRRFSMRMAST